MAAVNAVGNDLTGSTGTGQFVGDTSPTITTPVIAQINDANGNEVATFTGVASAVNEITVTNAPTGSGPIISATGGDTDISISLTPKGLGGVLLGANASSPSLTYYSEQTTNGTNRVAVAAAASMSSDQTVTWKSASSGYPVLDTTDSDAWTAFTPAVTGFSADPSTLTGAWKKIGRMVFVVVRMNLGTSNATTFTITNLPFTAAASVSEYYFRVPLATDNSGATGAAAGFVASGTTTVTLLLNNSATGWTNSGGKAAQFEMFYESV